VPAVVKYVADISHVREVSLLGSADLAFWQDRLRGEDLTPCNASGRARLLLSAPDLKFKGIRFRELSICALVSGHDDPSTEDGAFLAHAFNSNRFFAFCERTFFSTPYHHGHIEVESKLPASFRVSHRGEVVLHAAMRADSTDTARSPFRTAVEGFKGPVFLPRPGGTRNRPGKYFYARIDGLTQAYRFDRTDDVFTLRPSAGVPVLNWLAESQFEPTEWLIRNDATHGKSQTFRRGDVWPGPVE
jgi:hypothetical protein